VSSRMRKSLPGPAKAAAYFSNDCNLFLGIIRLQLSSRTCVFWDEEAGPAKAATYFS
jgi:hypothetical protein